MFIFCLEGERRQEAARFMGHFDGPFIYTALWHKLVSEGFTEKQKHIEERARVN